MNKIGLNFKKSIVFMIGIVVCTQIVLADTKLDSPYKITFSAPQNMDWQLAKQKNDNRGYFLNYLPAKNARNQSILINYGRGIRTSLTNAMNQAVNAQKNADCRNKTHKVLTREKNSLTFKTHLSTCRGGFELTQIFKVFNKPDGQYSIIYSAKNTDVNAKTIAALEKTIRNAKLIKQ